MNVRICIRTNHYNDYDIRYFNGYAIDIFSHTKKKYGFFGKDINVWNNIASGLSIPTIDQIKKHVNEYYNKKFMDSTEDITFELSGVYSRGTGLVLNGITDEEIKKTFTV